MTEEERTVRTAEAAGILGIHPQTLRDWERKGLIKSKRPEGTYRRWSVSELLKLKAEEAR